MKILIENGHLLTMATAEPELLSGSIGIVDGVIQHVGTVPPDFKPDRTIDATDAIVMPGLVNAHTHISMSLMRNYADDLPFWPWLTEKIWPIESNLNGDDCYWGAMLSIAEMIKGGVTSFADMYFFMDRVAEAVEETGIRANLSRGLVGGEEGPAKLQEAAEFYANWNGKSNGRIQVDLGPHAPYTCDAAYLQQVRDKAEELGAMIHIHLSESEKEVADAKENWGKTPIAHVNELGLFDRPTFAAHCVHLEDEDFDILRDKGVSVINNPGSNLKLGNGFAPVAKLLKHGVNVALGTDGSSSNNNQNLFEEMNYVALVNKGLSGDTTEIPAYTALQMGTINGAKALGIDHKVGSLEVGKEADIILVDINKSHFYPRFNLIASLIYSAQASDVKTVMVQGNILMENYHLSQIDEKKIWNEADQCAQRLKRQAGQGA